jgi:pSer/pThr/pTyr-binding forkhead associated (FHA) protein
VSDQLLTILKFCLLALIYLFFFRVLRAVWAEITPPKVAAPDPRAGLPAAAAPKAPKEPKTKGRKRPATQLLIIEPAQMRGHAYPMAAQLTVGRSANCQITIDDTFVSQVHARISQRDASVTVEDLGSTNGTFVNGNRLSAPVSMRIGDRVQFGNTVLELA